MTHSPGLKRLSALEKGQHRSARISVAALPLFLQHAHRPEHVYEGLTWKTGVRAKEIGS